MLFHKNQLKNIILVLYCFYTYEGSKKMKKILSVILCLSMILSFAVLPAAAKETAVTQGTMESAFADGEDCLIVFVTGIGQSYSYLFDESYLEPDAFEHGTLHDYENYAPLIANGKHETIWNLLGPDVEGVIPELVLLVTGLVASSFLGKYIVPDILVDTTVKKLFKYNIIDENGKAPATVVTPRYAMPVSEYPTVEREDGSFYSEGARRFYSSIPCKDIAREKLGENFEDYLYCFNYSAFSYTMNNAEELHEFVETILANNKVGAKKVVLVPMSMGASVVSSYLYLYPNVKDNHVKRVVSIVGCWNGSDIVSDLLNLNYVDNSKDLFYGGTLSDSLNYLAGEPLGSVILLAIRLFPQPMVSALLNQFLGYLMKDVLLVTPSILSLIGDYEYENVIPLVKSEPVRAQLETYHDVQVTLKDRLYDLEKQGVGLSFISGYGAPFGAFEYGFFGFFKCAEKTNSDEIINIGSTAPGTSAVAYNEKFTDTEGRRLSPDGSIDVSTAYFPDSCWYFKGQKHQLDYNNTALSLAIELALGNIETIYDCDNMEEDGCYYPQFNQARDQKALIKSYLPDLERYCENTGYVLSDEEQKTYDKAVAMLACTVNNPEYDEAVAAEFEQMLYDIGVYAPKTTKDKAEQVFYRFLDICDKTIYKVMGPRGYFG